MKFIKVSVDGKKEDFLTYLSDYHRVNENVKFEEKRGTPAMRVKEKDGRLKIKCEMLNRATKDNGFLVGTYFSGKISENNGKTEVKGVVVTAPIFHFIWFSLLIAMIIQCILYSAFSPIPILFIAFEVIMYSGEFRKQGYIRSYLMRAAYRFQKENRRK